MVVLENQEVIYFDGNGQAGESLEIYEGIPANKWPDDIKYAISGFLDPFLVIVGGTDSSVRGYS